MKILVINSGSSSIKYKLYEYPKNRLIDKGLIENVGEKDSLVKNHAQGVKVLIENIVISGAISDLSEISAIGHRVVHGGEDFAAPKIVDQSVIDKIKLCANLAPLHNPANLAGIEGCRKILPKVSQVVVFDTAFHQTISKKAYMYALPYKYYQKYKIRKYGFHGTSHQFVSKQASNYLGKPLSKLKLIICHLGNGCSITAVNKGKSVDTSMGFTPLEGLMMGTRSGNIDIAAVFHVMEKENLSIQEMAEILNKKSGFLGVSKISNDFRVIIKAVKEEDKLAKLALDMFIYRIKKYIGAYLFILGGADAVCFTGGVGENNSGLVNKIKIDILKITGDKTKVLVIPTDEELMIGNLTYNLVKRGYKSNKEKK